MKLFSVILSFYILTLITIPCVDVQTDNSIHKNEHSGSTDNQHHHDSNHCSPFCTCDCCVSPAIYQDNFIQFKTFILPETNILLYSVSYVSTIITIIWQPPELT
jgi:hypothetical protein